MPSVLFVCMGNICRSPTAEAVFTHLVQQAGLGDVIRIDSAGTGGWHAGNPPDSRAQQAAKARGYTMAHLRARQVAPTDFQQFDLILAMDLDNQDNLLEICPEKYRDRIRLFLDFAKARGLEEVPDPYYGGAGGFELVLDLVEDASRGLLEHLRQTYAL